MGILQSGSRGAEVLQLQNLLIRAGYDCIPNGEFDDVLEERVRQFQKDRSLAVDGKVGNQTRGMILKELLEDYKFNKDIKDLHLPENEYFHDRTFKKTIYLHHTAGGANPENVLHWWNIDNKPGRLLRVGTAFVIGGPERDGSNAHDGKVYRAFDERKWAHHLGLRRTNNTQLNQESIGIEICSYGPLKKDEQGFYASRKNKNGELVKIRIPNDQVCELEEPWRGHRFFHRYSEKQIAECRRLILTLAHLHSIPLPEKTYDRDWFTIQKEALAGVPGLWTHVNVRRDKTDCFPQPELLDMLNGLQEASRDFKPQLVDEFEARGSIRVIDSSKASPEDIWNYAELLDEEES